MSLQRTKGNGPYAPLGIGYYRDDAIIEAGEQAELLYVRGLAYCAEANSDGYITDRQLVRVVGTGMRNVRSRAARLVLVGLWLQADGGYVVRSWLKWNKTAEELGRARAKDRDRKASKPGDSDPVSGADSARNPGGVRSDSAPYDTTRHDTTRHDSAESALMRGGSGAEVAIPDEVETVGQRANRLTRVYTDVVEMSNFPAIAGVVRKAITARKTDDEITAALTRLAAEGRPVTTDVLRIEIDGLPPRASRHQQETTDLFDNAARRMGVAQ